MTTPQEDIWQEAIIRVEEEDNKRWAVLTYKGLTFRERIPRHWDEFEDEKRRHFVAQQINRLRTRLHQMVRRTEFHD